MRHESRESYTSIVAKTTSNNAVSAIPAAAEADEFREVPKWNLQRDLKRRALLRDRLYENLTWIRQLAVKDKTIRCTSLWHHICDPDRLAETFFALRKDGAVGVDGVDWASYEANLEDNLRELASRLYRGAYRAKPVRRVYIRKTDVLKRPLGITTLEDKLVQRTVSDVLSVMYESDFHDFSYGFRPHRGQHDALDQVTVAIEQEKVSWVLDLDIRAFFASIDSARCCADTTSIMECRAISLP